MTVEGIRFDKNGIHLDMSSSAEAQNWLLVNRLKEKARSGDKEAQRRLDELANEEMVPWPKS